MLGSDDVGESGLRYTWAATGTPPAAVSFSANGTNAAKSTTATFARAGDYSLQVTIADGGGLTATSSVNVSVTQTLSGIVIAPSSASVAADGTQQFAATSVDQFGVAMSLPPGISWSVDGGGTIDSSGLFRAGSVVGGPFTVQASSGSHSVTATVNVVPVNKPPTVSSPAAASSNPATGTTTSLSVLSDDDGGEAALTYTWATTGTPPAAVSFSANSSNAAKNTVAMFTTAGNYGFQVTIRDAAGLTTVAGVNVTVTQTVTTIVVSPASATVANGSTQQFAATARDQFGTVLTAQPVMTWTVTGGGNISAGGLFTATAVGGPFTAQATSGAVNGTASIMVTPVNAAPTVATAPSASPNPATGTTTSLSVLGDDDGGEAALTYTWATTGTPPAGVSFSANSSNAAKNTVATFTTAGNYGFQVTIRDAAGLTTVAGVNVTVAQTLTTIVISPASATVTNGSTQQFTATARDQFRTVLSAQPVMTWTVTGGGNISAGGLFTATTTGGPFTVRATAGSVSGTASVTVTAVAAVPAYVQGATMTSDSSSNTIARAFTASTTVGNLIVAAVSWGSSAAVTCSDNRGNAYAVAATAYDSTNNQSLAICYAAGIAGGTTTVTATFSGSAPYLRMAVHEYSGIATSNALDVTAKNTANGTTAANAITSTAAMTTASGDLIFGAVMDTAGTTTIAAGTGFTQRLSVNNKDLATEDRVQPTAGSAAATQTFGRAQRYIAMMGAFRHR